LKKKPSFTEFERMSRQGNLIPVYQEFLADIETPVSAYMKIRNSCSCSYLLESADGGNRWGRYSFIGYRPFLSILSRNDSVEVRRGEKKEIFSSVTNPFDIIRQEGNRYRPVMAEGLPPFQGGLVGYVNYDLIRKWEKLPIVKPMDQRLPELMFMAGKNLIVFDHFTHIMKVISFALINEEQDLRECYARACHEVDRIILELAKPIDDMDTEAGVTISDLKSNFEKEEFKEAVCRGKEYIAAGDIIQVVLSQQFSGDVHGDDFQLYRQLRSVNPSPYMFYLNFEEVRFIGASPEILVRLTDNKIELRPIAGTRPRGVTEEEDLSLERELMEDPKERAEHIMLVDLGRNDAGRVSEPGTVTVPRLMDVEKYSHVMHIVSRVEGTLKEDKDCYDLFMSSFPAGTVSGAPKIRAMEIIGELEPCPRGPYAGSVGYFGFNGNMDFCITIRTITIANNRLTIQAGAGIVADSNPEEEYKETIRKAGACFRAIERVKQ
jgi:anthranilate synthase component 1